MQGKQGPLMERIYMHYTRNNTCIHANHIREYQSQLWNSFSSPRTVQRSLIQTATLCEYTLRRQFISKNYISTRRDRRKIRTCHSFQNTSNSQRRTSQMICRSPTAYESRIYVLTITWRKLFLVFQLGEHKYYSIRTIYA